MIQIGLEESELISVVIPCYNSEDTVISCLDSVAKQTYTNVEVIVVDDGSADNTVAIVAQFSANNKQLRLKIIEQSNFGPSKARNNGVEKANGKLIAFLDSDDEWLPTKLQNQVELFNKMTIKPVLIGAQYPFGRNTNKRIDYRIITLKDLLWCNYFQTSSVIIPRKLLLKNKFNENQKYSEDYGLWLNLATLGNCLLTSEPATKKADRSFVGKGLSANIWQMEKGELSNYTSLYYRRQIKWYEYCFFSTYSLLKFLRRAVIKIS